MTATDYSSSEIATGLINKINAPTTLATGEREATLTDGAWAIDNKHLYVPVGRHYCTSTSLTNPIDEDQLYELKTIRQIQNYLNYQNWLAGDQWFASDEDYNINAAAYNNWGSWVNYNISSASGNTLTCFCNGDPRGRTVTWESNRIDGDPNQALETTSTSGLMPQVGDMVSILGNSVCAGRIVARITAVNVSGLTSVPSNSETFTITLDQSVAGVSTLAYPLIGGYPVAAVQREAFRPECWLPLNDVSWFKAKQKSKKFTSPNGVETLCNCKIAAPTSDHLFAVVIYGGEKKQRSVEAYYDGINTYVNLVPFNGADTVFVVYFEESTDTDAIALCPNRCHWDQPLTGVTTDSNGCSNSRHCVMRNSLSKTVVDMYENNCWLMGNCPYFVIAQPPQVNEVTLAQILQAQNTREYQLVAGWADLRNWVVERASNPSFHSLLNPSGKNIYSSPAGYYPMTYASSGGFILDTGTYTFPISGEQELTYITGAVYNYNYDTSSLIYPAMPADLMGIIPRSLSYYTPKRSYGIDEEYNSSNDPLCNRWWCGSRKLTSSNRDIRYYGETFAANHRYGEHAIEAENRNQRFNRTTESYIANVTNTDGVYGDWHTCTVADNLLILKFYADGVQDYGVKLIGNGNTKGSINKIELDTFSGSIYMVHCNPDYMLLGNLDSPQNEVIRPFFRGGNVVKLPDIYDCTNYYSGEWNKYGSPWCKAVDGDTVKIASRSFYITKAVPCSGEDFSTGIEASHFRERHTAGNFFTPTADEDSTIEIDSFEVAMFTATPAIDAWTALNTTVIEPDQTRPVGTDIDDCKILLERKITTVDGHTILTGSGLGYLSLANYYWAFLSNQTAQRQARVKYKIDGVVDSAWQTIAVEPVTITLNYLGANPADWGVVRLLDYGGRALLEYDGTISTTEANSIWAVDMNHFKIVNDPLGVQTIILVHPNYSGCNFEIEYETASLQNIGAFPVAHGGSYPDVSDLNYLKKCDVLYVQDELDYLANNFENIGGGSFSIQTNGVFYNAGTTALYYAEYDTNSWTLISSSDYTINYCEGKIVVDVSGITLPAKFNLKLVCPKANRTQELSAEVLQGIASHVPLLDTTREDLSLTGDDEFSVSCQGNISFDNWDYYGTYPYGYDYPAGSLKIGTSNVYLPATQDLTQWAYGATTDSSIAPYTCIDDFYYNNSYSASSTYAMGTMSAAWLVPGSRVGTDVTLSGMGCRIFKWIYSDFLKRLPSGTTIVDAKMELELPSDVSVQNATVYRTIGWSSGILSWLSSGGQPADLSVSSTNFNIDWSMVGKTNDGIWHPLGNFESGSLAMANKQMVVDATSLLQQMINYKNSNYMEIGFYVSSGTAGSIPTGLIQGNSEVGSVINLIRGGMFQITSLGENSENAWSYSKEWYYKVTSQFYTAGSQIRLGNCHIKYRLPDSIVNREITIGNTVGLKPIV